MPEAIQGAWIQVIGGGVFLVFVTLVSGFVGHFLTARARNRQKIIETVKEATPIVIPKEAGLLTVAIDKAFLTKKDEDEGQTVSIESAYSFVITVINSGTEAIEHPEVDITLDPQSQIVEVISESESIPERKIHKEVQTHKIKIIPEYINSKAKLRTAILSVGNQADTCSVKVTGLGLQHKETTTGSPAKDETNRKLLIVAFISIGVLSFTLALYLMYLEDRIMSPIAQLIPLFVLGVITGLATNGISTLRQRKK